MDEQQARQQLGLHWFITAYIAVYIQGLYTVHNSARVQSTVAMLELAEDRGCRQPPQGSFPTLALGEKRTKSEVDAGLADTTSVEAVKELPAQGEQKTLPRVGEKRFQVYSRLLLLRWWRYQWV